MSTNRFYATRGTYQIPVATLQGGGSVTVGRGVDMTDPQNPSLVPDLVRFFSVPMLARVAAEEGYEISGDAIKDTFALLQSDSVESEATALNTYFRASYGLASMSASMEWARNSRNERHSAYLVLTHLGDSRAMSPELSQVREDLRPVAETLQDDEAAFTQFRRDFGTHYIHAITYGLTIAIRGSLRSTSQEDRKKLGTRLKAAFGQFKAEAGVDTETKKQLDSGDLDLTAEVNCGGTIPARPLSTTGFGAIAAFLEDIRKGNVRFKLAPVEIHLASYWNLLDPTRLPRCRSLFDPVRYGTQFVSPVGTFGVPAGTILAWHPTSAYIEHADDPAQAVIHVPEGWALCDGQDGRPNLQGRFIRGTGKLSEVGQTGGSESHGHNIESGRVARIKGLVTAATTALVKEKIPNQNHLPPFLQMVYIIKLDDTR